MENNNTMTSCDLVYNSCGRDGGAVFAWSGSILENCKISLNEATRLGGGLYLEGSDANQCLLYSNQAEDGGGAYLLGDASLKNSTVERCEASDMGGGVYAEGSSTIAFNEISDNVAEIGAGAYLNGESYLVKSLLNHCVVFDNVANGESGAGVYLKTGGTLRNCTIVGNTGIGLNTESGGEVYNCIVWGNTQSDIHTSGKYSIRNTCARDGVQNQVNGCITINPRFDDYTYFDGMYYPYSLSKKSPCINRGDDNEVISTVDYKGVDRIRSTSSDIGAHETAYSGNYDTDLDGMLDEWEEEYFTTANRCDQSSDSDGDGFTNFEEYMVGTDPTNAVSYFEFSIGSEEGQRVRLHWTENLNELRTCRIYWAQTMTNEFECIRDGGSGGYVFNLDDEDYFSSELSPYSSGFFKVEIGFENDPRP
jgi:hypothetical protein